MTSQDPGLDKASDSSSNGFSQVAYICRTMNFDDLRNISIIHARCFPEFYLTRMGESFLTKYYRTALKEPSCIACVAEDGSRQIVGFILGFAKPDDFYKRLRNNSPTLFLTLLISIVKDPSLITTTISNINRVKRATNSRLNGAELASLASAKSGKGVGRILIAEFIRVAKSKNIESIYLYTDKNKNERVHKFYKQNGFTHHSDERRRNRNMSIFIRDI